MRCGDIDGSQSPTCSRRLFNNSCSQHTSFFVCIVVAIGLRTTQVCLKANLRSICFHDLLHVPEELHCTLLKPRTFANSAGNTPRLCTNILRPFPAGLTTVPCTTLRRAEGATAPDATLRRPGPTTIPWIGSVGRFTTLSSF